MTEVSKRFGAPNNVIIKNGIIKQRRK